MRNIKSGKRGGTVHFRYLYNRLLHRATWKKTLNRCNETLRYKALCALSAQIIFDHYAAIIKCTGEIRKGCTPDIYAAHLSEIDSRMEQLRALLPYANNPQQATIADAERTKQFARSIAPPAPKERVATEITYYSVSIPSMNGHFYYLAMQNFQPGDIVVIPFGAENMMIYGIVKEVFCRDYWKMPLPLWKMKYIDSMAPKKIADEYQGSSR